MPRSPRRSSAAVAAVLLTMVGVEAFALQADTLGVVVIGVLAGLALVIAVSGADLVKIGLGTTYLSAFTLTWNGWYVGPVRPGDVLPLLALLCFGASVGATALKSPPWWIKQLALGLVLLLVLIVLFPVSQEYLNARTVVNAGGGAIVRDNSNIAVENVGIIAKFIIAIAAIPICFAAAALVDRRAVRLMAIFFCAGAALSGAVAFIDHTGVADLGHLLTRLPNVSDRTVGFSNHPNFLAEALVLAAPFACWLLTSRHRWEFRLGLITLPALVLGTYASGSRGGAVCIIGAVGLAFILLPRTRPHLPAIIGVTLAAVAVVVVIFPSLGLAVLRVTRLYGNETTSGSDTVRQIVKDQGWRDFQHSPIHGIGMQASTDASQVYIQQLAAGGLLLFALMTIYLVGAAWTSFRMIPRTPIAAAICAAIVSKVALNFVEASLTDRFYYLPEAILVALLAVSSRTGRSPDDDASTTDETDEFAPVRSVPHGGSTVTAA